MRIGIDVTDDPMEIHLDVEHPLAEEAMGRAVELMKLLEDNIMRHSPTVPPKNLGRGFAGPDMAQP